MTKRITSFLIAALFVLLTAAIQLSAYEYVRIHPRWWQHNIENTPVLTGSLAVICTFWWIFAGLICTHMFRHAFHEIPLPSLKSFAVQLAIWSMLAVVACGILLLTYPILRIMAS